MINRRATQFRGKGSLSYARTKMLIIWHRHRNIETVLQYLTVTSPIVVFHVMIKDIIIEELFLEKGFYQ